MIEWKDINLRFEELKDGDIVVARIKENMFHNETGIVIAVSKKGSLYDHMVLEEGFSGLWNLTEYLRDYCFTGTNTNDLI